MVFYISYSKEAKSLTFRRGSEVSQVTVSVSRSLVFLELFRLMLFAQL